MPTNIACGDCNGQEFNASLEEGYCPQKIILRCVKCGNDIDVALSTEIDVTWPGKVIRTL